MRRFHTRVGVVPTRLVRKVLVRVVYKQPGAALARAQRQYLYFVTSQYLYFCTRLVREILVRVVYKQPGAANIDIYTQQYIYIIVSPYALCVIVSPYALCVIVSPYVLCLIVWPYALCLILLPYALCLILD